MWRCLTAKDSSVARGYGGLAAKGWKGDPAVSFLTAEVAEDAEVDPALLLFNR